MIQAELISEAAVNPGIQNGRSLNECPALVLNADFRPLSYYPLSLLCWQDALKAVFMDRVDIISLYDQSVRSPRFEMRLPAVVALKEYIKPKTHPAFTRFNVFLRDDFRCQYTGKKLPISELTFDHVVPKSRGGKTAWDNIVTAGREANSRKGSHLPHECKMHPMVKPYEPSYYELQEKAKKLPRRFLHESWRDYLYWDSELEK